MVVDDNEWSLAADLAWWEGDKELFFLEQAGCDILFPPPSWLLLGPGQLRELSSRADFFIVALDVTDEEQGYPLSRYMIRRQSPYSVVFSAGTRHYDRRLLGIKKLPLDSILPVTSSFVLMQADFFMFFADEEIDTVLSNRAHLLARGGDNRIMDFRFVSRVDFKLKEKAFDFEEVTGADEYLNMWKAYKDTLESEVVGSVSEPLSSDSLNLLATQAIKNLAGRQIGSDDITVITVDPLIKAGVDAGEITVGTMREIMEPEIFFLVDMSELEGVLINRAMPYEPTFEKEWAVVPSSLCLEDERFGEIPLTLTGITSARIARQMFFVEKLPTEEIE